MGEFIPTKAITVRVPIKVAKMLKAITHETKQTNKDFIENMIRSAYNDLFRK